MSMMLMRFIPYAVPVLISGGALAQNKPVNRDPLEYFFAKKYGQVEVGGPFVGVEFHESHPLPSRISFYYPVANSIDVSTDYWKRASSAPMALAIRIGEEPKKWIGRNSWAYTLSPHRVTFESTQAELSYRATYEFCKNQPTMVFTLTVKNITARALPVELYTHLLVALRTCQTYARRDSAWTSFDSNLSTMRIDFDDADTKLTSVFIQNVESIPNEWTSSAKELNVADSGTSDWISKAGIRLARTSFGSKKGKPVAAFVYAKTLQSGQAMTIIQVIGSCERGEVKEKTWLLASGWKREINAYDSFVRNSAQRDNLFVSGDPWLDRSATWARALLATNAHFLENRIVPMPCPAEYNFFFTHDLLMTNLGAVNYDLDRVRENLLYVASHAKENIIPHAFYWKDDGYKTEYCTPSNWNHLWFVLVSASYLRHSQDANTGLTLLPLITKSIEEVLTQKKADNLMYAYRPDWWDIGWNEGPRTYITALTVRALRDYIFTCSFLDKRSSNLRLYEALADSLQNSLGERLWDEKAEYLVNYNGGTKDAHYYMGSLLAPAFHVFDSARSAQLVQTATRELVDDRLGVRNAMPPDFHTDSMKLFFKFVDDEAGQPYVYANGGVWPHNNAWYVSALQAVGRPGDAFRFLKSTMTVDGVAASPMGQPAMYEYRFANPSSPEFGRIDKPSFLWAGGFYLYSLYRLLGFAENEWNLSLATVRPTAVDSVRFSYAFGSKKDVSIKGSGRLMKMLFVDGQALPSVVLPLNASKATSVAGEMGEVSAPYLDIVNAMVRAVHFDTRRRVLECTFSSFAGHKVVTRFVAPTKPKTVTLNGKRIANKVTNSSGGRAFLITARFEGSDQDQIVSVTF